MHNTTNPILSRNLSALSSVESDSVSDLYKACRDGEEELVRGLLISLEYRDANRPEPNGSTALHAAVYFGHANIVRLLLDFHVDRRQRNRSELTAYQEANNDEIRQLFHRPIRSRQRFCDDQSSTFQFFDEHSSKKVDDKRVAMRWVDEFETDQRISQYRQLLSMGKYLWSSEWGQKYMTFYNRYIDQNNTINLKYFVHRLEQLIDENFPLNSGQYPAVRALFDEYQGTERPEPLFTLYTLDSPFYTLMTESLDNASVFIFLIWKHLNVLTPRFFRGTSYRGLSMTHDDLQAYQWALENSDRILGIFRFCSSSTERHVAEFYGEMASSDRIRTLLVFNFDRPCNGAIRLYSPSNDLPCLSNFENEREVLILPATLFRVWKIEIDEHTGQHVIYLNQIPEAENPGLHCLRSSLLETFYSPSTTHRAALFTETNNNAS